ncbi:ligand-binding sensor domain-containing protein [Halocalculus aciditolerans]|uniref:Uncharacterized protein n=1 Tax=Halocalculus aciditolerans TaxID=1383812 RepID=A0A830FDX5_9EURY|nr:hypothetical protein [Halocalculus aciditolerans]GGL65784.1 hypothetical protein GCM10009039_24600 [Halocalculus aciditolerans]
MVARYDADERTDEWTPVETPVDADLHVVAQAANGTYALGERGTLLADRGRGWEVVIEGGPSEYVHDLDLLAVTADGNRLWLAGDSGALACYDTADGQLHGYTTPGRAPSRWDALDVAGPAGNESVLIADDSGYVRPFDVDGYAVSWGVPERPTDGDPVTTLAMTSDGHGYAIDASGYTARRTEHGWDLLGPVNPNVTYHDVHADPSGVVYAAATDRRLYRLRGEEWEHLDVSRSPLVSVEVFQGRVVALDESGALYSRRAGSDDRWARTELGSPDALGDVELGYPDVVVGENGAVFECVDSTERTEASTFESRETADADDPLVTEHDIEVTRVDGGSHVAN